MKKILLPVLAALLLFGVSCAPPPTSEEIQPQSSQQDESSISSEEQAFLDSGRAKAYEDGTDTWPFYSNEEAGLMVSYPLDIDFASDVSGAAYRLDVEVSPLAGLEGTMGYNEETARQNMAALANGDYGDSVDFPLAESEQVRAVGEINAQDFLVLGRFEVCSIVFERKLYFFHNDHQVVLTLSADSELLLPAISDYLAEDQANCGDQPTWIFDQQPDFYQNLADGNAPPIVQDWYDLFDQIVATVELFDQAKGETAELIGKWRDTDDGKSVIEFSNGQRIDYYDDQLMSESAYEVEGTALTVTTDGELYQYTIVDLTDELLTLTYLPRGNSTTYSRE